MILLICDHKKREIDSLKRLKAELSLNNIKAIIINKHCVIKAFNYYKPKIITFPHCNDYLANTIKILGNRVTKILIPTEHCAFVEKFLSVQYFGSIKSHKINNKINKIDYIFTQSNFTKNFLIKSSKLKKDKIINSGHLYYNEWSLQKSNNKNVKKIGIALTNEFILRRYKGGNYLESLFKLNKKIDLTKNSWRLQQMSYDQYYFCLIYELINRLSKDYKVELRTHVVDSESNFDFLIGKNVSITKNLNVNKWIKNQDLIISTHSFINVDSYICGKPHISLLNIIPKEFYFNAYKTFSYKDFPEVNSIKPKSLDELMNIIKKIKFKKNNQLDFLLKKFFSFPYKKSPIQIIKNELIDIMAINNKTINKPIMNHKEKLISVIIGKKITFLFSYLSAQIKIFYNKSSSNSYFDFLFFLK